MSSKRTTSGRSKISLRERAGERTDVTDGTSAVGCRAVDARSDVEQRSSAGASNCARPVTPQRITALDRNQATHMPPDLRAAPSPVGVDSGDVTSLLSSTANHSARLTARAAST